MKKVYLIFLVSILFSGCVNSNSSVMPKFPTATKEVGAKIKGLNDKDVDSWIIELFKLKTKLELSK